MLLEKPLDGRPRIVFFGLAGHFAGRPLRTMAASGLAPVLVIEGLENLEKKRLRDDSRRYPVPSGKTPSWQKPLKRIAPALLQKLTPNQTGLVHEAHRLGIEAVRTRNANGPRVRNWLHTLKPELFVICGFPHLLAPSILKLASKGGLNLHPGKLPAERGPAPLFWALKAGRNTFHWTIHLLTEKEDAGDIISSGEFNANPGTRGLAILDELATAASYPLVRAIRDLLSGEIIRTPQPEPENLRAPRPRFRDGRIDASRRAQEVYTFVAGCAGRYPLFVESAGDRYFVEDAVSYDEGGQLAFEYALMGDRLLLRCSPGVVELRLRPDGAIFAPDY